MTELEKQVAAEILKALNLQNKILLTIAELLEERTR